LGIIRQIGIECHEDRWSAHSSSPESQ
jgi:hypothetical protein